MFQDTIKTKTNNEHVTSVNAFWLKTACSFLKLLSWNHGLRFKWGKLYNKNIRHEIRALPWSGWSWPQCWWWDNQVPRTLEPGTQRTERRQSLGTSWLKQEQIHKDISKHVDIYVSTRGSSWGMRSTRHAEILTIIYFYRCIQNKLMNY